MYNCFFHHVHYNHYTARESFCIELFAFIWEIRASFTQKKLYAGPLGFPWEFQKGFQHTAPIASDRHDNVLV